METIIKLNKEDVIKIIAEYFEVDKSKVNVELYTTTAGYGIYEYEITDLKVEIKKS